MSWRTRSHCGALRIMKASQILTPVRKARTSSSVLASATVIMLSGFFAEHMLAGFRHGLRGPRNVELIGQRIVDGIDLGIVDQILVRAVSLGNTEFRGRLSGFVEIARSDGCDDRKLALLHGRDHFFEADVGGAEYSETKFR